MAALTLLSNQAAPNLHQDSSSRVRIERRRYQTNNKNKSPLKGKQKLDGSDLLIERRLVGSHPSHCPITANWK